MASSSAVGLNVCLLGLGQSSSSVTIDSSITRQGVCCHGLLSSEKKGRRALLSLLGILSSPALFPSSPAHGATPIGQGPENARFSGEGTDTIKWKTRSDLGIEQPISPLINISAAETLLDGENMMEEVDRLPLYLNTFGYMASAILGSLFWYERQTKASSDDTIQDLKTELGARENAILTLKQRLEASIYDKEETMELELQKKREQNSALCNELEPLVSLFNELKAKIRDHKNLMQDLHDQMELLEGRIAEAEKHKAGLEDTLLREKKKSINMEEKTKELIFNMQRKDSEVNEAIIALEEKEEVIARFSHELNGKTESFVELQRMIEVMERDWNEKDREVIKNESSLRDVKVMLSDAIARAAKLEKEVMSTTIESENLKNVSLERLRQVQATIISKEVECKLLNEKLTLAVITLNEKKKTIVDLQEETHSLMNAIREGEIEIKSINDMLEDVGVAKDKDSSLSCELDELKQENARLEKQALEVGIKLNENLSTLNHALHQEEQAGILLKDDIRKCRDILDRSNNEVASLREKLMRFESSYNELRREAFESAENVKALELEIAKQKEVSDMSKRELGLAQKQIIEAEKEEKILEQDLEKARLEKDDLINKIFDLHEQLDNTFVRVSGVEEVSC